MRINAEQLELIKDSLPIERGNVKIEHLDFINALLYVLENGCKWRRLPKEYGNWHTIYTRMNRWSKLGVLDKIFAKLQEAGLISVQMNVLSLDSTIVKVHPDGTGALKKTDHNLSANPEEDGRQKYIWLPQMRNMQ